MFEFNYMRVSASILELREVLLSFQTGFNLVNAAVVCAILERIMTDALEDHAGTVSIAGRAIANLRYADDIDGLAGEEEELAKLVERLDKASTACGMEISAEKTRLMTNNTSGINTEIKINGKKLETVTSFKYLGSVITDVGSKPRYSPG